MIELNQPVDMNGVDIPIGTVAICALIFLSISATNIATHVASPEAAMVGDVLEAMKD